MNSTSSQTMPGAASATQNAFPLFHLFRMTTSRC
jgi:hypothetical protein